MKNAPWLDPSQSERLSAFEMGLHGPDPAGPGIYIAILVDKLNVKFTGIMKNEGALFE